MSDNSTGDTLTVSKLIDDKRLAEWLQVSEGTPANWRHSGAKHQPPFVRLGGRSIRYRVADVEQWLQEQTAAGNR